jgi:hypothetical protein
LLADPLRWCTQSQPLDDFSERIEGKMFARGGQESSSVRECKKTNRMEDRFRRTSRKKVRRKLWRDRRGGGGGEKREDGPRA